MSTHLCSLNLSPEVVQAAYTGALRYVQARSTEGLQLRFPITWLRPYVRRDGVHGTFALIVDAANRLQSLRRLEG